MTDRLQLVVAGVELWSRTYLSTLLVFALSALAPGLIGDANRLPDNKHIIQLLKLC